MTIFPLPPAITADWPLETVLARLSRHPNVDGLVTIGSTGQSSFTPASDYDLLIVLAEMPVPLEVGITYIDHRLTDLLFATTAQVDQILATRTPLDGDAWEGRIARWLMTGKVVFDRHGCLGQAQAKVRRGNWLLGFEDIDAYGAWIGVNFNLVHTRRLMQSDDPVKLQAAELRMSLYGVSSLLYSYFRVRKLPWEGDKAAIRYFTQNDPAYLTLLQLFLRESNLTAKFAAYEQVAAATLEPISPLWSGEPTVLWNDTIPATWEMLALGLTVWEELTAGINAGGETNEEER